MSLTRKEYEELYQRCKRIDYICKKIWRAKHYKYANQIHWEVLYIKEKIQQVIGQME